MKRSKYNSFNELPLMLTVQDVADVLGIGLAHALSLIHILLKKLIAEQVSIYRRTNVVKSEKFSEIIQSAMNRYLNGMLTNEEVIEELLKLAKDIAAANAEGEQLGLTAEELAFYDALTKPPVSYTHLTDGFKIHYMYK